MRLALVPQTATAPSPAPPAEIRRTPSHISFCLTPHAFVPEPCPAYADDSRWVRTWCKSPASAMAELCTRLGRAPHALTVVDRPESGDVEVHGRLFNYDKQVPLALVAMGLDAAQCAAGLAELAKGAQ